MLELRSLAAASAALLLLPGAQALIIPRFPEAPVCPSYTPFTYKGCYQETSSPRTLLFSDQSMNTQNMTVEYCTSWCKGNGYRYAGLEYYGECFCGSAINGPQVDESNCAFPCTGNKNEKCGGNGMLNIWEDPTFNAVDTSVITDYAYAGCYTEGVGNRALVFMQSQLSASTMTTEICLSACKAGGFNLAGTEYGGECYCGVVLDSTSNPVDPATCKMPCNGNSNEICGGPSLLSLYVAKDLESNQPCIGDGVRYWTGTSTSSTMSSTASSSVASSTSTAFVTTSSASSSSSSTSFLGSSTTSSSSSSIPTSTASSSTSSASSSASFSSSSVLPSSTSSSSSSSSSSFLPSSTTSSSSSSTIRPTTTTAPSSSSSTLRPSTTTKPTSSSSTLCTTTTTIPAPTPTQGTCQYTLGNWCSTPIPNFTDANSCRIATSTCWTQYDDCVFKAGWPAALSCYQFSLWCSNMVGFCGSNSCVGTPWSPAPKGQCVNAVALQKFPPRTGSGSGGSGGGVVTTTMVGPCGAAQPTKV